MNKIFDFFDAAWCVNLQERVDRKENVIKQFQFIGLEDIVKFHYSSKPINRGVYRTRGAHGCAAAHMKIFKEAKSKGLKNFIIFEDDVVFDKDFKEKIKPILKDLEREDWDIFYFFKPQKGQNDLTGNRGEIIETYESGLSKITGTIFTHAYAINSKCLDILIEKLDPMYLWKNSDREVRSLDKAISNLGLNYFACNKNLTKQDPDSKSSIYPDIDHQKYGEDD